MPPSGQMRDHLQPMGRLAEIDEFEEGDGQQEDHAVAQGQQEQRRPDRQFLAVAPQPEVRDEPGRPRLVGGGALAAGLYPARP